TERKQADAGLRESEERFRRVFEEGPLGLALVGRDYRFLKVNSALCQMVVIRRRRNSFRRVLPISRTPMTYEWMWSLPSSSSDARFPSIACKAVHKEEQ